MTTASPFRPTPRDQNFRRNAVQIGHPFEDDAAIGFGFISAADALIQHWREHGPDDGLLLPMIWNFRHGLELLLKAAIRDAARCLRLDGDQDADLAKGKVDNWLSYEASHSLEKLMNRLDELLERLKLESIPAETRATITSLHALDPKGDTFRYATSWDKNAKKFVPAKRPKATHIDVENMGEVFDAAANLIGGGILTVLEVYRDNQQTMGP